MAFYVIIRGPLGCGKSTIARSISKELNSEYLEVERVLDENDLTKEWEKGYISQKSFIKANEIIASKAKSVFKYYDIAYKTINSVQFNLFYGRFINL